MPKNNVHVLTEEELRTFKQKYLIVIEDDKILVKFPNYARVTVHDIDKPFAINAKNFRKICFSMEAINFWKKFMRQKYHYTLFDVQNAVNFLYVTYQQVNEKNVKTILAKDSNKIRNI